MILTDCRLDKNAMRQVEFYHELFKNDCNLIKIFGNIKYEKDGTESTA